MATFHVIYDPSDRIHVGPPDKLPVDARFIAMKVDDPVENKDIGELVGNLSRLLLEQL